MRIPKSAALILSACTLILGLVLGCDLGISPAKPNDSASSKAAFSAYIYVSPSGSDANNGSTPALAVKTLARAAELATWGNTIKLTAGTYTETKPAKVGLGVSIEGAGESQTIITSSGVTVDAGVDVTNKDYKLWHHGSLIQLISDGYNGNDGGVHYGSPANMIPPANGDQTLSGFTIDGGNRSLKAGVWVLNRNNVTMHHVTIKNCAQRGAVFSRSDMWWYEEIPAGMWMKNTRIYDCTFIDSGAQLSDEFLADLCIGGLDGADIYNITINDKFAQGIKFIYVGHFRNVKIHDSTITMNEALQVQQWAEPISIELWNLERGNEIYNIVCNTWLSIVNHKNLYDDVTGPKDNLWIHHVTMVDKDGISIKEAVEVATPGMTVSDSYFEDKGFGMGVWMEGKNHITINNNIFYNKNDHSGNWAAGAGIFVPDTTTNLNIYNNVFDNVGTVVHMKGNPSNVNIKNNLFLNPIVMDVYSPKGGFSLTNNIKYNFEGSPWKIEGGTANATNLLGNPGLAATGNRWDNYYKAASASSLMVDRGVAVGLPSVGVPDVGRWEFGYVYVTTTTTATVYSGPPTTTTSSTTTTTIRKARFQAENCSTFSGIIKYASVIGDCDGGDWVAFNNIDFGNGFSTFKAYYGTSNNGSTVQVRIGSPTGTLLGSFVTANTGGYGTFVEKSTPISQVSGVHTLYVVFVGGNGVGNFDWFELSGDFSGPPPSTTTSTTVIGTTTIPPVTTTTVPSSTTTTVAATTTTVPATTTTTTTTTVGNQSIYQLINQGSNKSMQAESWVGGSVYNADYSGANSQKWAVASVGTYVRITNVATGLAITATSSSANCQTYTGADSQLWTLSNVAGGTRLINKASGNSARVQDIWNGNPFLVASYDSSSNLFKWTLTLLSGPPPVTTTSVPATTTTTLAPVTTTTVAATTTTTLPPVTTTTIAPSGPVANGTYNLLNIGSGKGQQSESWVGGSTSNANYVGAANQKWIVTGVGSYYKIVNLGSGCALAADGSQIRNQVYTGSDAQLWTIASVGSSQFKIVNKATGNAIRPQDVWNGNPIITEAFGSSNLFKWSFGAP